MQNDKVNPFKATRACQVFIAELGQTLERVSGLTPESNLPEATQSEIKEAFHKIKGAAGIFGFAEVGQIAGALEEKFKAPVCEIIEDQDELNRLLQALGKEYKQLCP